MLEKLFHYFQGYLILEINGSEKERFINLCKNREIEIIHIFATDSKWYCKIKSKHFFHIKDIIKKTGCSCKIDKKIGVPFVVRKAKKRKGLIIGTILFLMILSQCSGRIWDINVEGGFLHTKEQILQVMKQELGVYGGVPTNLVDCFEIEKQLRLTYNDIGWISAERKGCRICVSLNESVMPEHLPVQEEPCHIIAARDGIVRKMEVRTGVPKVKVGDVVKKGDILIAGIVPVTGDYKELIRNQTVAADGLVYIESNFSYNARLSRLYEKKNYKKSGLGFEIFCFGEKIFSYIPRYSDGKYDIMSIDIVPYAFDNYQVPVILRKHRILPYDSQLITMSEEEVLDNALSAWEEFLSDWRSQGVEIISTEYVPEVNQKICVATGTVTACGNFISYQEILEEEWKIEDEHSGNNP
ncbi:MAG: sporulation protein YqfD [Lachnospiraceae bacterium]|nr:sporulation protein YqfD [Lachnospiraceae bacterium]